MLHPDNYVDFGIFDSDTGFRFGYLAPAMRRDFFVGNHVEDVDGDGNFEYVYVRDGRRARFHTSHSASGGELPTYGGNTWNPMKSRPLCADVNMQQNATRRVTAHNTGGTWNNFNTPVGGHSLGRDGHVAWHARDMPDLDTWTRPNERERAAHPSRSERLGSGVKATTPRSGSKRDSDPTPAPPRPPRLRVRIS